MLVVAYSAQYFCVVYYTTFFARNSYSKVFVYLVYFLFSVSKVSVKSGSGDS